MSATGLSVIHKLMIRHAKQLDKTTEIEILKADLEERGFNIKVSFLFGKRTELIDS
jgi:cell division control protein 12